VTIDNVIRVRSNYDGNDLVNGAIRNELVLPGGTQERVFARRSVLEALRTADQYLADRYGGDMHVVVVDAFRSQERQAAGFTRKLIEVLNGKITPSSDDLYDAGIAADGTFSLVRADRRSSLQIEARSHTEGLPGVRDIAERVKKSVLDVAQELVDISANVRVAGRHFQFPPSTLLNMDLPLDAHNNAHAGGGAVDAFLFSSGKLLNGHVPFDWVGVEASMDFLEDDANFDAYKARVQESPILQEHLRIQGIEGDITPAQWKFWRDAQRIMFHTMRRVGSTFFSDRACNGRGSFGGENWHFEPGNVVYDRRNRHTRVVYEGGFASQLPNSGNPGHALQKMGARKALAVWGGNGAHQQLRQGGFLDETA
jgi:hypothetical protein